MSTDTTPSQTPPDTALAQLLFGKCISMAISVVAKLRIADLLADGPKSLADLATRTETHAPSLYRILRTLASAGVFTEQADDRFALTPTGEYLRTGVKGSLRGMADFFGSDWSWRAWGHLLETVHSGRAAFDSVFGESAFDYLGKHPDESAVFNEGMTGFTSNIAPAVAEAYNFAAFKTVVDVGGGHGVLLNTILQAHPGVNGIVFDSPHVVVGAEEAIAKEGLTQRCRAVGGDFFQSVPAGADAYLMKHIIHDWPDDRAATILRNCRKGVNPGGKLLLVELVIAPGDAADLGKVIDLEMLVIAGGRERTELEYRQLLAGAGWRLTRVLPTESPTQIVEAEPA
jgi:2-polyprenyl-3-methyl-5-hydroxy-6-metoxy-1,4-benzoquinol methylase